MSRILRKRNRLAAEFGIRIPGGGGGAPRPSAGPGKGFAAQALHNWNAGQQQHPAAAGLGPTLVPRGAMGVPAHSGGSGILFQDVLQTHADIQQGPTPQSTTPGMSPPPPADPSQGGGGGGGEQAAPPPPQDQNDGGPPPQEAAPQDGDAPMPADVAPDDGGYYEEAPAAAEEGGDPGVVDADYYGDPPEKAIDFPLVNAHVRNGHLRTMAILRTPDGVMPLTTVTPILGYPVDDGYVHFGAETNMHPGIDAAVMTARGKLLQQAEHEKIRLLCESLVRRSRSGDQNATALLAEMAKNAKAGDPRARYAYSCTRAYIQANPAHADIGDERPVKTLSYWTAVTLANGAPLTKQRIASMMAALGNQKDMSVFLHGYVYFKERTKLSQLQKTMDEWGQRLMDLGRSIGEARALQMARKPRVPLKMFDKAIAWEFGE